MDDVEKIAKGLNDNMVKTMTWWSKGGTIQCDVPKSTQNALVKRGLAFWPPNEELCADLTELGLQVQAHLVEKAQADQDAKDRELAAKFAAERKIRDEGYEAGVKFAELRMKDEIKGLWETVQILVSRYPNCETVITESEMRDRSDLGVVSTADEPDGGRRFWVRQR